MFEIDPELEAYIRSTYPAQRAEELLIPIAMEAYLKGYPIFHQCLAVVRIYHKNHKQAKYIRSVENLEKVQIFINSVLPILQISQKERFQIIEAMLSAFSIGIDANSPRDWEYAAIEIEKQIKIKRSRSEGGKKSGKTRQDQPEERHRQIVSAVMQLSDQGQSLSLDRLVPRIKDKISMAVEHSTLKEDLSTLRRTGQIPKRK